MIKYIKGLAAALVVMVVVLVPALPAAAAPIDVFGPCSGSAASSSAAICKDQKNQKLFGPGSIWNRVLNTLIYVIGVISVLMIIIGGFRYVTSNGDTGSVTAAKNTILYAVIGLVVAALSFAIVNFVLSAL